MSAPDPTSADQKMTFTRFSLTHRHAIWALAIAAALFGTVAYLKMPVQLFPDTAPPIVNIITVWPGASAEDVADDLARPMEEAFASLEGIVRVQSRAQDNLARVTLEFSYDRPVEVAAIDVQNALARIRGDLPKTIQEPQVLQFSTNDRPVITVGVGPRRPANGDAAKARTPSAAALTEARQIAEDRLSARIQRVPGVAGVDVYGGARQAVLVELSSERLAATGLTLRQLTGLTRAQNLNLPAGDLRLERSRSGLRLEARVASVEALANLPLPAGPGRRVLLGDIATVRRGRLDDDASFAIDGRRAIAMAVYKTSAANTVDVVNAVSAEVERLNADFPALELRIGEESGSFAATSIANLIANVWQALALAAVLQPVRSWRLDQPRDVVRVDRQRAASVGLVPAAIAAKLNAGSRGLDAGDLVDEAGISLPVRLRYIRTDTGEADDLLRFPVKTPAGPSIPLCSVAHPCHRGMRWT